MSFLSSAFNKHGLFLPGNGGLTANGPVIGHGGLFSAIGAGDVYFVDPTNGSDSRTGRSPAQAFQTLAYAEDKLTANQNDVLFYIPGTSSLSIVDTLVWDKSYTHFIGLGAPTMVSQRARIFNSGNSSASTPLLNISASGCIFQNFMIFQGSATATAGNVLLTGDRNYFNNVHIAGPGHATMAGGANAYNLKLDGGTENTFVGCTIGLETIKRTADNSIMLVDTASSKNNFIDCRFISWAETNTYCIVKIADSTGFGSYTIFDNCFFYNFWQNHAGTLLEVFDGPATSSTFDVILHNCLTVGCLEWEDGDGGYMWVDNALAAATTGIGLAPAL